QRIQVQPLFHSGCDCAGERAGRQRLIRTDLRRADSAAGRHDALMRERVGNVVNGRPTETVAQAFVAAEEKRLVFYDRTARSEAELVSFKRRFLTAEFVVFPLRRVERGVAE